MTPETIHCYCIRLALLLFFQRLEDYSLCPTLVCEWPQQKCTCKFKFQHSECKHFSSTHLSSFLQTDTVNDQFNFCSPVGLHVLSFEPTALHHFSEWFYLMFLFFTNQELLFRAITFIQVPYQYRLLCYFLSYKRNMGKDWCWNWRGKRNPWTTKRGNPL